MRSQRQPCSQSSRFTRAAFAFLACGAAPALAADQYWDTNGAAAGLGSNGGTPTWSTAVASWNDATGTAPPAVWTNGNSAIFSGTAGTVNVSGSVQVENLTFNTNGYIITGGTNLTFVDTSADGAQLVSVGSGVTASINSVIAGADAVSWTKTGTGTLILGGTTANTFTGQLNLNDGTIELNKTANVNAIGSRSVTPTIPLNIGDGTGAAESAVLRITAGVSGGNTDQLPSSNRIAVTLHRDGLLDLNGRNETIHNFNSSGGGKISTGGATLTVNGTNGANDWSYTAVSGGTTAVIQGNLHWAGNGSTWTINDDAALTDELQVTGAFTGSNNFRKLGAGTLAFQGNSTGYTGTIQNSAGTIALATATGGGFTLDGGAIRSDTANDIVITGPTVITSTVGFSGLGDIFITADSSFAIGGTGRTWTVTNPVTSVAGTITSTNLLTKAGGGELVLTGASSNSMRLTITGGGTVALDKTAAGVDAVGVGASGTSLTVTTGTLRLDESEQVANGASASVAAAGVFDLNGNQETLTTFTLNASGDLLIELDNNTPADNSRLIVLGNATLNGDILFSKLPNLAFTGSFIDVVTATNMTIAAGTLTNAQASAAALGPGYSLAFLNNTGPGGTDVLRLTVPETIPEPASMLLLAGGAALLAPRRREARR